MMTNENKNFYVIKVGKLYLHSITIDKTDNSVVSALLTAHKELASFEYKNVAEEYASILNGTIELIATYTN